MNVQFPGGRVHDFNGASNPPSARARNVNNATDPSPYPYNAATSSRPSPLKSAFTRDEVSSFGSSGSGTGSSTMFFRRTGEKGPWPL
ncbi:hypothetical protein [Streptomyces sp. NPDC006324]|uniref:hypothetical protein n=1 Tax=Streptomyces sp. NPDC006324 TaxID=3156751 RepID=UPI00339E7B60